MKLRALAGSSRVIARPLMMLVAAIAAFCLLGAFVDALHVSIRKGEALRESQRSGAAVQSSPLANFSSNTRLARM
jgi:hypothetical protein